MITVENLCVKYGAFEAVRDVSFTIGQNEVLGFLGPNGAGKTTVMRILAGYHFPCSGTVCIDGLSLEENTREIQKRIGYLSENVPLYGDLTPWEFLHFAAEIRSIPKEDRIRVVEKALLACGIENRKNQRIETLSRGLRQRVGLAQAILHDPPILILDEPMTGLDPNQIMEIRSLIKELGKTKTVIFSTHILQEVESICSSYIILNKGRIAAQGLMEEIETSLEDIFIKLNQGG